MAVRVWVLTDGKAGDEQQCLGVAEALGGMIELRRVKPWAPIVWLMPYGPIDPFEAPGRAGSPIAPPFPDVVIGSGRRAVPYMRHVRRASRRRSFTVFLQDPAAGARTADLRGPNVIATLTPPHRFTVARLAAARAAPDPRLAGLPRPRVAVLAGGPSKHYGFAAEDAAQF